MTGALQSETLPVVPSAVERFERTLPPDWDAIKAIWDECQGYLQSKAVDTDTSYSLSMVTQELLENAVKYGHFDPGRAEGVKLSIEVSPREVIIEVKSPTASDPLQLKKLDDTIQWIRGFQNPFEAYVERLKEVSAQPYTAGESGLGLARVAYEGQCILDFYVDESDTLALSAVYPRAHAASGAHA